MTSARPLRRILVVGGSIAAVTAADSLRLSGFDGELTLISGESDPPYSRVPLSKGVLAGTQSPQSVWLGALPESVNVRLNTRAKALHTERHCVELADGAELPYDGLVVATGATARRLAEPGQEGELVVRDLHDASLIARRAATASTAVVIGGGFLGMEIASTLASLGVSVTLVDREPPLQRLLGRWLAELIVGAARESGVRFVLAPEGVTLVGNPVEGVTCGSGRDIVADLTISAVGDLPAVGWLESSGLPLAGGLVIDGCCRVAPRIVAAGDVTVLGSNTGVFRRTPHWTSAVQQAQTAARCLLDPTDTSPYLADPYFWTEQFGLDVKISGELPLAGEPQILAGDPTARSALLQWRANGQPVAAAAVNHRLPVIKLKKLRTQALSA